MPEPRFRTERCRHGLAVGLCEDRTCKGSDQAREQSQRYEAGVAEVKPPRCSRCRSDRADAIVRVPATSTKRQRRICDDCWARKVAIEEAAAVRKRFHIVLRAKKPKQPTDEVDA